jgi:hypothetical protein
MPWLCWRSTNHKKEVARGQRCSAREPSREPSRGPKIRATRISCCGDPPTPAYAAFIPARAAFIKESRMKFANAYKLDWKSGGSPTIAFAELATKPH